MIGIPLSQSDPDLFSCKLFVITKKNDLLNIFPLSYFSPEQFLFWETRKYCFWRLPFCFFPGGCRSNSSKHPFPSIGQKSNLLICGIILGISSFKLHAYQQFFLKFCLVPPLAQGKINNLKHFYRQFLATVFLITAGSDLSEIPLLSSTIMNPVSEQSAPSLQQHHYYRILSWALPPSYVFEKDNFL